MIQPLEKAKQHFANKYIAYEQRLNGHSGQGIHQLQRLAFERFQELQFPDRKNEDWKYSPVTKIVQPEYAPAEGFDLDPSQVNEYMVPSLEGYTLVFLNGQYREDLSNIEGLTDKGLQITPLAEALDHQLTAAKVGHIWQEMVAGSNDIFVSLNAAMEDAGWLVHLDKNAIIEKPIYLLHVNRAEEDASVVYKQVIVWAETGSQATIIDHYVSAKGSSAPQLINSYNAFEVEANAEVSHYNIQTTGQAFIINNTRVAQERDSRFNSYVVDLGGKWVRNNLYTSLKDSNTETNLSGVYFAKDRQHIDNQTFIDHAFPHCISNEHYKGIVDDRAEGVFNGKVIVRQDAQKTNAFQQNSTLLLSEKGKMNSKPQLEIFADDVKCSHGATTGQLDEEALFYLRARGLDKETGRAMLQFAFLEEILEHFKLDEVKSYVEEALQSKFES